MTKNTQNSNVRLAIILAGSFIVGMALSFPIHWLLEDSLDTSLINNLCTLITLVLFAVALKVWYSSKRN